VERIKRLLAMNKHNYNRQMRAGAIAHWSTISFQAAYYSVLWRIMHKTVSFRTDAKKVKALDALASEQDRDRSYLLNQAIDNYLDLQQYHVELIEKGIRQADAGELVDHRDVEKIVAKLRRKK
jgi:predicted transcriptional regulator